jgi:hypothetical protein
VNTLHVDGQPLLKAGTSTSHVNRSWLQGGSGQHSTGATEQQQLAHGTCCSVQVAALEHVLRGKMAQLSLLSAENQALRQREQTLQVRILLPHMQQHSKQPGVAHTAGFLTRLKWSISLRAPSSCTLASSNIGSCTQLG